MVHNYANIFMREIGIKGGIIFGSGSEFWFGSTERGSQVRLMEK